MSSLRSRIDISNFTVNDIMDQTQYQYDDYVFRSKMNTPLKIDEKINETCQMETVREFKKEIENFRAKSNSSGWA